MRGFRCFIVCCLWFFLSVCCFLLLWEVLHSWFGIPDFGSLALDGSGILRFQTLRLGEPAEGRGGHGETLAADLLLH